VVYGVAMRVLICGSRNWTDHRMIEAILSGLLMTNDDDELVVIEGHARGADQVAHHWAERNQGVELMCYPADWETHGKSAGPVRNRLMLKDAQPTLVLGFTDDALAPGSGTYDMLTIASNAGVKTQHLYHVKTAR
jgi:YspA, cpYpsA-related SLOG family